MHRLPGRIAAVMVGTIAVFILTVGISVLWMSRALDSQAREHSLEQIGNVRANLLGQTRMIALDYAKWEAALPRVAAGDIGWIHENIGASAMTSQLFQMAVVWSGPFARDIGWLDDGVTEGRAGLVDPATIGLAESRLRGIPLNAYDGIEFFAWRGGELFVLAASRFEAGTGEADPAVRDRDVVRLLFGLRLTDAVIERIGKDYLIAGLEVVPRPPPDRSSLPLDGGAGEPVAYLAWEMPQPGTAMLLRMGPLLGLVILLVATLAGIGMTMVRRSAQSLVVAEHRASAAARTDAMTGLPNRAAFNDILAAPARAGGRAVLFLDVNDFKRVNDSIGHAAGDEVISLAAERLGRLTGPGCVLARIAGDEFVFVVTGPDSEGRAQALADRAREVLSAPFGILGHQIRVDMAMGYAVQATEDMTGADLVRQADLAMYEAKRHKREPGPVAFSAVIEQTARDAQVIEWGLRKALAGEGELSIAYQPIVAAEGRLARAEALARWTSPELGPVPPDRFIAVAEQAGLIVELGRRLLQLVCDDLAAHPGLAVSVNISTLQLMAPDFIPRLIHEVEARGLDRGRIEVELTEAVLVDDPGLAAQRLEELRAAGFSIALDDFGTGYSSVGYLEQLRFDTLKIDRSFVAKIRDSADGIAVVDGMIRMAHGLRLRVVCEGVETAEELDLLRGLGADLAQGYHLDRPLPIAVLAERWIVGAVPAAAVA